MVVLPKSDHFDSVTCSAIADLDLDGDNEIILGTYGQVNYQNDISSKLYLTTHWQQYSLLLTSMQSVIARGIDCFEEPAKNCLARITVHLCF